jgi:hypothetical protein
MSKGNWAFIAGMLVVSGVAVVVGGWWHNTHDPVIQAMTYSLMLSRQEGMKYDALVERERQLRLDSYQIKFGRPARLKLEARGAKYWRQ